MSEPTRKKEESSLLDVRSMVASLKAVKEQQEQNKNGASDFAFGGDSAAAFSAPQGPILMPRQSSKAPLIAGLVGGGVLAVTALILGTLFAVGVFDDPPPAAAVVIAPPPVAAPPAVAAPEAPAAADTDEDNTPASPKKSSGKTTKKTSGSKTASNTNTTAKTPPPPPKKKHSAEADELLGILK